MLLILLLFTSCKEKSTNPPDTPLPEGYQQDVPWPSLADSPWPMYRSDPQNTGRLKGICNTIGNFIWKADTISLEGGIVINSKLTLFAVSTAVNQVDQQGGLLAISPDGTKKNISKVKYLISSDISPIILSDGTIIYSTQYDSTIIAVSEDGSEQWRYRDESTIVMNTLLPDLDGNIYAINTNHEIFSLNKKGELLWKVNLSVYFPTSTYPQIGMSPDGRTLYITGTKKAILAFDITSKTVKWQYGNASLTVAPLIDSYGKIYILGNINDDSLGTISVVRLTSKGEKDWEYVFKESTWEDVFFEGTLDKYGNFYFAYGKTLYNLNYFGKENWKVGFVDPYSGNGLLTCDEEGKIYLPVNQNSYSPHVQCYNNTGILLYTTEAFRGRITSCIALSKNNFYVPAFRTSISAFN
jgi:hypothetical protein